MGCSNITILQSDFLFKFVGLGTAVKNDAEVIGLVFNTNMVVSPTDTEKHSMCIELILFQDNSVSDGGTYSLPEPPSFSDDVQDKKYILELHKSDSLSSFAPQWVEKTNEGQTNNTLIKNGTYYSTNGSIIFNTLSLTEDELTRLNNKEINTILGSFILTESGNQTDYCIHFNGSNFISYEYTMDDLETYVDYITYGIMMIEGNQAILARITTRTAFVPKIPEENNKILITNNGKLKYVDIPGSIEVNPSEEATDTLNKLKIDGTVYNFNNRLEKTGTLLSDENGMFVNAIFLTDEEFEKVKNGEIDTIYGTYYKDSLTSSPYACYFSTIIDQGEGELSYVFTNSSSMVENGILSIILFQCTISKSNSMLITIEKEMPAIPLLPTDASGKTLSLISTNGSIGWKDTSVGTQKFENVEVSGTITAGGKSLNAVEANPSEAATTPLNKIKIGNAVYNIVGSSSSGGSSGSDGSTENSSFVAFEYNNIITNGKVNDGVFQELTNLINAHKMPIIIDDQHTYSYSGIAMSSDGSKSGFTFATELHMYEASNYTYLSAKMMLILWSDNSISTDIAAFSSIPYPPDDPSGTKHYVLSIVGFAPTWIDIDEKISSAITSTLEADY